MSFLLRDLIDQYKGIDPHGAENGIRGEGAACVYAFFVLLGVKQPVTGDLSENLVKRCAEIMAEDLPAPVYQVLCRDLVSWLSYIHKAGYCAFDWSQCLEIKPGYENVTPLTWRLRGRRD